MLPIQTPDKRFHDGNGSTITGTIVTADFMNSVQDEIINVITGAKLAPSVNPDQLKQAISTMIADNIVDAYTKTETDAKFLPIYPTIPTKKKQPLIYVTPFGVMQWIETWNIYRSIECGRKVNGWSRNVLSGYIEANGAILPKTGNYYALYTAAKDYDIIHADAQYWQAGEFLFAEIDDNNFKLPDIRGYSDRNASMGSTVDAGRALFTAQEDAQLRILGKFYVRSSTGARSNVFTPADSPFSAVRNSESNSDPLTVTGTATSDTTVTLDTAIGTRTADEVIVKNTAYPAWIKL